MTNSKAAPQNSSAAAIPVVTWSGLAESLQIQAEAAANAGTYQAGKLRGQFAISVIDRYAAFPDLGKPYREKTLAMLSKLKTPQDFPAIFWSVVEALGGSAETIDSSNQKKAGTLDEVMSALVCLSVVLVSALGDQAVVSAAKIFEEPFHEVVVERVIAALKREATSSSMKTVGKLSDLVMLKLINVLPEIEDPELVDKVEVVQKELQRMTQTIPAPFPALIDDPELPDASKKPSATNSPKAPTASSGEAKPASTRGVGFSKSAKAAKTPKSAKVKESTTPD